MKKKSFIILLLVACSSFAQQIYLTIEDGEVVSNYDIKSSRLSNRDNTAWIDYQGIKYIVDGSHTNVLNVYEDVTRAVGRLYYGDGSLIATDASAFTTDGFGTIVSYDSSIGGSDVVIPYRIGSEVIVCVGEDAFSDSLITSVVGTYKIERLLGSAFSGCTYLTNVLFRSVIEIGENAFKGCSLIEEFVFPSVLEIGDNAFVGCISLSSLRLGSESPSFVDLGLSSLDTVVFVPDESVGYGDTFDGRPIVFPSHELESLKVRGGISFSDGSRLDMVDGEIIAEGGSYELMYQYGTTNIVVTDESYFTIDEETGFILGYDLSGGQSVVIPLSIGGVVVRGIGSSPFSDMGIEEVFAPRSVVSISDGVFIGCSELRKVSFPSVVSIGLNSFMGCHSLSSVFIPVVESITNGVFSGCSALKELDIPFVKYIGVDAFEQSGIESLFLGSIRPGGINTGMRSYQTVVFVPSGATGYGATFDGVPVMHQSLDVHNLNVYGVTSFNDGVITNVGVLFYTDGSRLDVVDGEVIVTLTGDKRVQKEMYGRVLSPSSLDYFTYSISGQMVTITGCDKTGKVVVPYEVNGLPVVGLSDGCFKNKKLISEVVIPNSVFEFGVEVFMECSDLVDVRLPVGMDVVRKRMFYGCVSLRNVFIPSSVVDIESFAFFNCSFSRLVLSEGVVNLGSYSFANNIQLEEVVIPSSVSVIDGYVFSGCTGLRRVEFDGSRPSLVDDTLYSGAGMFVTNYITKTSFGFEDMLGGMVVVRPSLDLDKLRVNSIDLGGIDFIEDLSRKSDALYGRRASFGPSVILDSSIKYYDVYASNSVNNISFDFSNVDLVSNVANWTTYIRVKDSNCTVVLPDGVVYMEDMDLETTFDNQVIFVSWSAWQDGSEVTIQASQYGRK